MEEFIYFLCSHKQIWNDQRTEKLYEQFTGSGALSSKTEICLSAWLVVKLDIVVLAVFRGKIFCVQYMAAFAVNVDIKCIFV